MSTERKIGFLAWFNALGTMITVGALIFYGGSLWSTVNAHENRLVNLESKGSVSMQRHEAMDDERINALRSRIAMVEQAMAAVADLKGDMRIALDKLEQLKVELQTHEKLTQKRFNQPNP